MASPSNPWGAPTLDDVRRIDTKKRRRLARLSHFDNLLQKLTVKRTSIKEARKWVLAHPEIDNDIQDAVRRRCIEIDGQSTEYSLALLYLLNDVVIKNYLDRAKHKDGVTIDYSKEWGEKLFPSVFPVFASSEAPKEVRSRTLRVVEVWRRKGYVNTKILDAITAAISKRPASAPSADAAPNQELPRKEEARHSSTDAPSKRSSRLQARHSGWSWSQSRDESDGAGVVESAAKAEETTRSPRRLDQAPSQSKAGDVTFEVEMSLESLRSIRENAKHQARHQEQSSGGGEGSRRATHNPERRPAGGTEAAKKPQDRQRRSQSDGAFSRASEGGDLSHRHRQPLDAHGGRAASSSSTSQPVGESRRRRQQQQRKSFFTEEEEQARASSDDASRARAAQNFAARAEHVARLQERPTPSRHDGGWTAEDERRRGWWRQQQRNPRASFSPPRSDVHHDRQQRHGEHKTRPHDRTADGSRRWYRREDANSSSSSSRGGDKMNGAGGAHAEDSVGVGGADRWARQDSTTYDDDGGGAARERRSGFANGAADRRREPIHGSRDGAADRRREPIHGSRDGAADRRREPIYGSRDDPVRRKRPRSNTPPRERSAARGGGGAGAWYAADDEIDEFGRTKRRD